MTEAAGSKTVRNPWPTAEIAVRWVVFDSGEKVGEGTTVATRNVLNRMVDQYAREGRKFLWERR